MAKVSGIGVNNIYRKSKDIEFGIADIARKVKRAYIGVDGIARLFYAFDWWMTTGLSTANILAAYSFKGATSEAEALRDLSGNNRNLTNSGVTFNSSYGFQIPGVITAGLLNSALTTFESCVIRFSNVTPNDGSLGPSAPLIPMSLTRFVAAGLNYGSGWAKTFNPCIIYNNRIYYSTAGSVTNGVLGTSGSSIFINGSSVSVASAEVQAIGEVLRTIGCGRFRSDTTYLSTSRIQAVAFYNVVLSAEQQKQIYNQIVEL